MTDGNLLPYQVGVEFLGPADGAVSGHVDITVTTSLSAAPGGVVTGHVDITVSTILGVAGTLESLFEGLTLTPSNPTSLLLTPTNPPGTGIILTPANPASLTLTPTSPPGAGIILTAVNPETSEGEPDTVLPFVLPSVVYPAEGADLALAPVNP